MVSQVEFIWSLTSRKTAKVKKTSRLPRSTNFRLYTGRIPYQWLCQINMLKTDFSTFAFVACLWFAGSAAYGFGGNYTDLSGLILSAFGIVIGIAIIKVMLNAFSNSSPFSQGFGEFFMFGAFKWDDYAGILIVGVLLAGWGICTLLSQTTSAIERAAHDSTQTVYRFDTSAHAAPKRKVKTPNSHAKSHSVKKHGNHSDAAHKHH